MTGLTRGRIRRSRRCLVRSLVRNLGLTLLLLICSLSFGGVWPADMGTPVSLLAQSAAPGYVSPADAGRISVVVELADAPVAQAYMEAYPAGIAESSAQLEPAAVSAAQLQLAAVEAQQQAVLAALAEQRIDATVLYRTQRIYNGMGLRVAADAVPALEALPQVVAVHPLIPKAPATGISVPHIHAPQLWESAGAPGLTGAGVRIAIIDTGVDYLHTHFGGPGGGYSSNNTRVIGDVPNFPGPKIAGGWDFAGNDYNADPEAASYAPVPMPNPDPMDCYSPGHGTHVSGIVGGYGVAQNGSTYAGPYAADLNPATLRIGPGVAPHAQLYALKVFGCQGKTALVDAAIEWAVDPNRDGDFSDRMDIINLSLGSAFGAGYDATAIAADNAARLGIVVVSSAGNSGDTVYATGSPGIATGSISVAATQVFVPECGSPTCDTVDIMAEFSARGPRRPDAWLKPDLAAPGQMIFSARAGTGSASVALSGTSMAAPHIAGAAALLLQEMRTGQQAISAQDPDPEDPPIYLWQPGDVKARLMNTARQDIQPSVEKTVPALAPVRVGAGAVDLTRARATEVIAYSVEAPAAVSVSFGAPPVVDKLSQTRNVQLVNRGPHPITFTVSYSAVLAAPGITFTLPTAHQSPTQMPTQTPTQTMTQTITPTNTPTNTQTITPSVGVAVVALEAYGTATLPLHMEVDAATLAYVQDPNLTDTQFPRHWLGEAGGYLVFAPVTGKVTDEETDEVTDEETDEVTDEVTGDESARAPHPALVVPVYAAPQAVATLQALPPALDFGDAISTTRTLQFVGSGLQGATPPTTPVSLAGVVELHHVSNRRATVGGLPSPTFAHADLRYVGAGLIAGVDMAADTRLSNQVNPNQVNPQHAVADPPNQVDDRLLYFGIVTHAPWSTLNAVEFNIWLDTDGDRQADYRLYNSDLDGYLKELWSEVPGSDVLITALENLETGDRVVADFVNGASAAGYAGNVYNTPIVILPVPLHLLQWDDANIFVNYRVSTYSRTFGNHPLRSPVVDATPWLRMAIAPPALGLDYARPPAAPQSPLLLAAAGTTLDIHYRAGEYGRTRPAALLLLQFHNQPARRAELVPLSHTPPFNYYLPQVVGAQPESE